jgi:hypothetical protein
MAIPAAVLLILMAGLAVGGALWLDRRERRAAGGDMSPPQQTSEESMSSARQSGELTDTRKARRHPQGQPHPWVTWRRLTRWCRRRWCEARHRETWKRMTEGANSSTWYCRRCGRTWTFTCDSNRRGASDD